MSMTLVPASSFEIEYFEIFLITVHTVPIKLCLHLISHQGSLEPKFQHSSSKELRDTVFWDFSDHCAHCAKKNFAYTSFPTRAPWSQNFSALAQRSSEIQYFGIFPTTVHTVPKNFLPSPRFPPGHPGAEISAL